jgi:hypothetical protein
VGGIVTLYDVALQAAFDAGRLAPAVQPSFRQHIQPVIERATNLRWTADYSTWNAIPRNWSALANPSSSPQVRQLRKSVFDQIVSPGLTNFVLPDFLHMYLEHWRDGNFISEWSSIKSWVSLGPVRPRQVMTAGRFWRQRRWVGGIPRGCQTVESWRHS